MQSADAQGERGTPVGATVILIDPESMTVIWMNELVPDDIRNEGGNLEPGASLDQVVPIARTMGVLDALRDVADTGVARHLRTNLVSTARGRVEIVASIYRLPDARLLLLMEHAFEARRRDASEIAARRTGRRRR